MPDLTPSQQRILVAIRMAGREGKVYNDRARRPLEALEAAGLIRVEWDYRPQVSGSGIELVGHHTCYPLGYHR